MSAARGLARKLKKVLETRTDSPDLLASHSVVVLHGQHAVGATELAGYHREARLVHQRGVSACLRVGAEGAGGCELVVAGLAECCERYS